MTAYNAETRAYLDRIYDDQRRAFACQATNPSEVEVWQEEARPALRALIGLDAIDASVRGHRGTAELDEPEAMDGYTRWGEFYDVAGLIAPRPLLIVNGRQDPLFPLDEVDRTVEEVRAIYGAADASKRFAHRYGKGGHRFYAGLVWPFIRRAMSG
jgi:hypothetical protein